MNTKAATTTALDTTDTRPDDDIVDGEIVDTPTPSTAVEVHTNRTLVEDDEWAGVDDGDLSPGGTVTIPLYQLSRKSDGGFLNEDTGELVREVEAVLMAKVNTRAWWPEPYGKGDDIPSCRSNDGVTPDPEVPAQQPDWKMPAKGDGAVPAKVCAECPNSQWNGDEPPTCTEAIEFLSFVPTDHGAGRLARLRFSGMALAKARSYWTSFQTRLPKRPPIAFVTSITLEEKETENGTFLVPAFRRATELTRHDATPVLEARDARSLEWRHAVATDERPMVADAPADGPFDEEPAQPVDLGNGETF